MSIRYRRYRKADASLLVPNISSWAIRQMMFIIVRQSRPDDHDTAAVHRISDLVRYEPPRFVAVRNPRAPRRQNRAEALVAVDWLKHVGGRQLGCPKLRLKTKHQPF
jgi:hypothetical protein